MIFFGMHLIFEERTSWNILCHIPKPIKILKRPFSNSPGGGNFNSRLNALRKRIPQRSKSICLFVCAHFNGTLSPPRSEFVIPPQPTVSLCRYACCFFAISSPISETANGAFVLSSLTLDSSRRIWMKLSMQLTKVGVKMLKFLHRAMPQLPNKIKFGLDNCNSIL